MAIEFSQSDLICFDPNRSKPLPNDQKIYVKHGQSIAVLMNDKCMDIADQQIKSPNKYNNNKSIRKEIYKYIGREMKAIGYNPNILPSFVHVHVRKAFCTPLKQDEWDQEEMKVSDVDDYQLPF